MQQIPFDECRTGMAVVVSKGTERWTGTVTGTENKPRFSVTVDVPTYEKDGTTRSKWKRKDVKFTTLQNVTIHAHQIPTIQAPVVAPQVQNPPQNGKITTSSRSEVYSPPPEPQYKPRFRLRRSRCWINLYNTPLHYKPNV